MNPTEHQECIPLAPIPAWWSTFLFQVLNPRQVCMFAYLSMLCTDSGSCHPTTDQIREELGLYSSSMVFDALSVLEDLAFIERQRQTFPGTRPRRNVYRRPRCETTLLRLLERGLIDGELRPTGSTQEKRTSESMQLVRDGLQSMLEDEYERYATVGDEQKRDVLVDILQKIVAEEESD